MSGHTTFHGLSFDVVESAVVKWTPSMEARTTKPNIEKFVKITGEFDAPLSKDEVAALIECLQTVHDSLL